MIHKTLEDHVYDTCSNHECLKKRNGEDLNSFFDGSTHYLKWKCSGCGVDSWFKAKTLSSGIHHMRL